MCNEKRRMVTLVGVVVCLFGVAVALWLSDQLDECF